MNALSIRKSLNKILDAIKADYIVEEGDDGDGSTWIRRYRKWKSGKAEFWYHTSHPNGATTQVWASPIYYRDYDTWSNIFGNIFNAVPESVICTSNNSQFIAVIPHSYSRTGVNMMRFISVNAKSNVSYSFSLYAIGTWK